MGEIFAIVAPVFLCAGVGWAWARAGRPFDRDAIAVLNMEIGAPCLVFSRLVALEVEPAALAEMAGAALLSLLAFAAIGWAVLRAVDLPRHTFLPPLVFTNSGNMGLPVCLFAFGDEGLSLAIAYFAVCAVLNFSAGPPLWRGQLDRRELLRTPVVYAVLLAVAVVGWEIAVPAWLLHTTRVLGDFAIPMMLLTLGVSLAELRVAGLGRTLGLAALRLAMGFGVGVALAAALGLSGVARGVLILQCAMPAAVFNHLFAQRYRRSPEQVASLVVVSTLLGFAALPWLLRFVLADA